MSAMSRLRRALLTGFATEEELDRIGRNLGVSRLPGMSDETYRCLLQTMPYLPKSTVYGLELLLECLFPGGGATVYEDLVNFPNKVFILIDAIQAGTNVFEGKAFMFSTGADVTPPTDPASPTPGLTLGRGRRQLQTSSSTSQVTAAGPPVTVQDILQVPTLQLLPMTVLPSAATPAWTFVPDADSGPVEADVFSLAANGSLQHTPDTAPSDDGGRYKRAIVPDNLDRSVVRLGAFWRGIPPGTVTGRPFALLIDDEAIGRQYGLFWGSAAISLGNSPVTAVVSSSLAGDFPAFDGSWYYVEIERVTVGDRHLISARVDGRLVFSEVDSALFAVSALNEAAFGFVRNAGDSQTWTVQWDQVRLEVETWRNHWNLARRDGAFSGTNARLTSAAALFLAGDVGRKVRILTPGTGPQRNLGIWQASAFNGAGDITLTGVTYADQATVVTESGVNYIDSLDPLFTPDDRDKKIQLTGSVLGNNTISPHRTILEVISSRRVRVSGAAFVAEVGLDWAFVPWDGATIGQFAAATGMQWEVINTGSAAGAVLTVRDLFPAASTAVELAYTKVLSAQVLRNEFVQNEGSAAVAPDVYYPFYVFDVDRSTRQLMDEVTAAGVLPAYQREF